MEKIDRFTGEYEFLSNFYENAPLEYKGLHYTNSEAAFHAQKTLDPEKQKEFTTLNPGESKKMGRSLELRPDWEDVKLDIMYEVCKAKFTQNPSLKERLIETGDAELIEGNTWYDQYWGVCDGVGENHLGIILMRIRGEFQNSPITHIYGDIFKADADLIIHQVNCQGVMGSGIAKQVKEQYPHVYRAYAELCKEHNYNTVELLGKVQYMNLDENRMIANVFGQGLYGYDGKRYTDYDALVVAMKTIAQDTVGKTVAVPYLMGCCRGGGDWEIVSKIIETYLSKSNIVYYEYNRG